MVPSLLRYCLKSVNVPVRLFVEAIYSLSGFDGFQTGTTETNEFYLVFYEFYILEMSLTSLP